ncbi:MAG: outer membrane protein assembly factor, partial [Deltaproteobacteria bacterium]
AYRGESLPLSQRFYLGGRTSLRGFARDSIGSVAPLSAQRFYLLNLEARFDLPANLGVALFVEGGNVFERREDAARIHTAAGLGLRYHTPVGPLSFDFGFPLRKRAEDDAQIFSFNIGQAF